ncbi:hypothetical protein [Draconibacterium halophilum]|uniref:Uncharacterized protein n=1 Tax=Draconibacterium halophilum TaxID=2706887 RepID=A0A6C0RCP0_9BACT|nr:hypothetical protein [Draconibacterium halophilum]QIA08418.1 hypothetical protein G0Q07_12155 [Draconibacterium halophilum]
MKKALIIIFFFSALFSQAQEFNYQFLFEGIGDNREFTQPFAYPQTIMGSRGAFEIGVDIDNHQLRGGLSHLIEFGSDMDAQKPKLTLYYQFQDKDKEFAFGAFPRRNKIDFPLAMLTDTLLYYRPNIEGMFGEISWDWGHQNGFVDWVGRQTEIQREQFMAGLSGEIFYKNLFLQNYLLMFHNAHTLHNDPPLHIEDYMGLALQGGIRVPENIAVQGHLKMGLLTSQYRERNVTDGYETASSFFAEAIMRYKNFGIKSVMNLGAGHKFAYGDPYYRAKNYSRTDLIWYFINHEKIKGKFNLSMHFIDWDTLDQQQQLSIIYVFGK